MHWREKCEITASSVVEKDTQNQWNEILFKGTFHLTCTLKFKMYFHLLCTFSCNSRQVSLSVWLMEVSHHLVDESKVVEG